MDSQKPETSENLGAGGEPVETPIQPDEVPGTVTFFYMKAAGFRTIHVDGGLGGPSPEGFVRMAIYNQRLPIPQESTHELKSDGRLGDVLSEQKKKGIVREVEADLIMTPDVARAISVWLSKQAESAENVRKEQG
jgi:hypothetical protein